LLYALYIKFSYADLSPFRAMCQTKDHTQKAAVTGYKFSDLINELWIVKMIIQKVWREAHNRAPLIFIQNKFTLFSIIDLRCHTVTKSKIYIVNHMLYRFNNSNMLI